MCSLFTLAEMFELPPAVVHSTISKMIINEELQVCKQYMQLLPQLVSQTLSTL